YLDNDILPRLQELIDENNRLTTELEEAHNRVAELENAPQVAAAPAEEADEEQPEDVTDETPVAAQDAESTAPQETVTEAPAEPAEPAAEPARQSTDESATGIIALANRLHDEYVKNGEDERDRLIGEAND